MEFNHKPVLLNECLEGLDIKKDGIYVDGTLGGAGHSYEIIKRLSNSGLLIGIDKDRDALLAAEKRLSEFKNFKLVHSDHKDIKEVVHNLGYEKVDGILLDLGVSSYQLDEKDRGFSYSKDSKLDMRMDKEQKFSAHYIVNNYTEEELTKIFFEYGEERYSKSISRKICEVRDVKEIETTFELVDVIKSAVPKKALMEKQHPAKRVFQAIRIEVNGELKDLKETIIDAVSVLKDGGRLSVITFHSLEDKIVKNTYEDLQGKCTCPKDFPICVCGYKSNGKVLTKKPVISSEEELTNNHRARSAKLRVFKKIENNK